MRGKRGWDVEGEGKRLENGAGVATPLSVRRRLRP